MSFGHRWPNRNSLVFGSTSGLTVIGSKLSSLKKDCFGKENCHEQELETGDDFQLGESLGRRTSQNAFPPDIPPYAVGKIVVLTFSVIATLITRDTVVVPPPAGRTTSVIVGGIFFFFIFKLSRISSRLRLRPRTYGVFSYDQSQNKSVLAHKATLARVK